MIYSDKEKTAIMGTKLDVSVEFVSLMNTLIKKGVLKKSEILYCVDLASMSENDIKKEMTNIAEKVLTEMTNSLGEDEAGEFFRKIFERGNN